MASLRNILAALDRHERDVDRAHHRLEIERVRLMKLGMVAGPAAQRDADQQRDLVGVVDLGDGVDAGEEARRAHQSERPDAAEERAGAQADRGFLAVDLHVAKARIDRELHDQRRDPAVRQARHQRDAALRRRVGNVDRNGAAVVSWIAPRLRNSKSHVAQ